jgi:hypothetical protein
MLGSEIHKLIKFFWNEENLPRQCKELTDLAIRKKKYFKTGCSNYRSKIFTSISFKILYNFLLSRLTPCPC